MLLAMDAIGHFQIHFILYLKGRLSAKTWLWRWVFILIESRTNFRCHIKIFALRLALKNNSEMVHLSIMLRYSWVHDSWEIWLYFLQTCNCVSFCPVPEATATKSVTNEGQTVATVHPHPAPTEPMIQPSHCVAGYSVGTIRIFDLGKVEMIMKMQPHNASITAISFSADGKNSGNLKRQLMKITFSRCNGRCRANNQVITKANHSIT